MEKHMRDLVANFLYIQGSNYKPLRYKDLFKKLSNNSETYQLVELIFYGVNQLLLHMFLFCRQFFLTLF